jgi:hypothetical protein
LKAQYPQNICDAAVLEISDCPAGVPIGQLIKRGIARELIFHLIARRKLTTGPKLMVDDSALVFAKNRTELDDENSFARWFGVTPWGENL